MDGVLDARTEEATRRFEAELATAVAEGQVTESAAQKLRAWQRASTRELAEHVRTVLPAALRAVDVAREEAVANAEEIARHLVGPTPESTTTAASDAIVNATKRAPEARRQPTTRAVPPQAPGDLRRASPARPAQPRTLEDRRPRLLVADLTETRKDRTN